MGFLTKTNETVLKIQKLEKNIEYLNRHIKELHEICESTSQEIEFCRERKINLKLSDRINHERFSLHCAMLNELEVANKKYLNVLKRIWPNLF